MKNRISGVVISDSHAGHKYGLCNPDTLLYDFGPDGEVSRTPVALTATQEYLWQLYLRAVARASKIPNDLILFHLGDHTNGLKYPEGLMRSDEFNQYEIARRNFDPWLNLPNLKAVKLVYGTGSHEFGEGSAVLNLAMRLTDGYPKLNIMACRHGLLEIDNVRIDYAHHGPGPGIREWTKGNVARHYLRSLMMAEVMAGKQPPDLVLRGHFHTPIEEVVIAGPYESRLIIMPSLCGQPDYVQQSARSEFRLTNGAMFFHVENGKISRPEWDTETLDLRTKESIN